MRNKEGANVVQMPGTEARRRRYRYHVTEPSRRDVGSHGKIAQWLNAAEAQGWEFVTCGLHHQEGPVGQHKTPLACWIFRQPVEA